MPQSNKKEEEAEKSLPLNYSDKNTREGQDPPLHFILDHIDGDASNNFEFNLRLICPNCDSQLDTYKSRNKNSARTHRKNY